MTRVAQRLIIFSLVLMANILGAHPCAAAVVLRGDTDVGRPTVKLSDVFEGLPDGIDRDIARAPAPGKSIVYDVTVLTRLAQQYKLDWQPQNASAHIMITTISTRLTSDDIGAAVADKVKALGIKGDIDVAFDNRALGIDMPVGQAPNFMLNNFAYDTISKRFHAELVADAFAGPLDLPLSGHITIRHSVPVLARRLEAGTVIGIADIDWLSVPDDRMVGLVTEASELIDHELRRDTDGEEPVSEHDVMPPRLVVRGTLVTMKIEMPLMIVTAQGRALQDGKRGDVVRVINTQSNRTIEGTVESAGVVRISMAQKLAAADDGGKRE
jgi:flagella basal body P-ring formation protein FlgA